MLNIINPNCRLTNLPYYIINSSKNNSNTKLKMVGDNLFNSALASLVLGSSNWRGF